MLVPTHVDADTCNLASCEMCALVLCAFWKCARSSAVDELAHYQRLRLYTNLKCNILHRPPSKVGEFLQQEGIFYVLGRTSFHFVVGHFAAKITLGFNWSVVGGLDWVFNTWETGEFFRLICTSTSVRKTIKTFLSLTRWWSFLSCLGALLVPTRKLRIATIEGHRRRSLLLVSLLLPHSRRLS